MPKAQRRGLGTALVRGVLADAAGPRPAGPAQRAGEQPGAAGLYERLGFRVTGGDHPACAWSGCRRMAGA